MEENNLLGENQAGFRSGYSTPNHIFTLHLIIELYLHSHKRVYTVFIDYKKAFDFIERSSLWHKVLSHNINGKLFNVIHTMYSSAKACIKTKNTRGNLFISEVGLRQGDNLFPLLFSIYLNDFELFLSKYYDGITFNCVNENDIYLHLHLYTLLYADDTIIMAESEQDLQTALDAVFSFCKLWYLELNISKTKVIIFSRGKVRKHIKFAFDGTELEVVDQYTYLGVTFNYNNTFYKSIARQISHAKKAMFSLITKSRRLDVPIDITLDLFDKLVLPILIYGSEVWGHSNLKPTEFFYMNFIRRLLKLGESTSNCMLYGETRKTSIQPIIEKRMISFWLRLTQDKPQRLIYVVYSFIIKMRNKNQYESQWIEKIVEILQNCGMFHYWKNQNQNMDIQYINSCINVRINDIWLQSWNARINSTYRCTYYKNFKDVFKLENYLLMEDKYRINISKFRCRYNHLPISRKYSFDYDCDIRCKHCLQNDIGDEYHYLIRCDYFLHERQLFINKYYIQHPSVYKFIQLMQTENSKNRVNLARFITIIINKLKNT